MNLGFLSIYVCLNFIINFHFWHMVSVQTHKLLNIFLWCGRRTLLCVNTWLISMAEDQAMFVERKVCYSAALFTNLVRWHASAVSFPLSDVILAQLVCPLSDIMFWLHTGITNLSLYKHWDQVWSGWVAEIGHWNWMSKSKSTLRLLISLINFGLG
jgi:hypothetical protein